MRSNRFSSIVVKRFDRMQRHGKLYRVHPEAMCKALGFGTAAKYESEGGPGVPDIMKIAAGSSRRPEDREATIDAVVFNYLILGSDAHAKNYSLLHTREGFILAPICHHSRRNTQRRLPRSPWRFAPRYQRDCARSPRRHRANLHPAWRLLSTMSSL